MPPLRYAIYRGDTVKVQQALKNGADVNAIDDRDTMLCWALRGDNPEVTKLLLQSPRVDVNKRGTFYDDMGEWTRPPLILAARSGQAEMVSLLLKKGALVNARDSVDGKPEARGETALLKAAEHDYQDVLQVLVTQGKGLEINAKTTEGKTALWFLAELEDLPAVKLLHEHGAAVNIANNSGGSVLSTTILHKKHEVLDYLVAQGADVNMDNGGTTLMDAVEMQQGKDAKRVLDFEEYFISSFKPKLDLQRIANNNGGFTALQLAAQFGRLDSMALLLDHGATLDLKSLAKGGTALHYAVYNNQMEAAKLLIKRKANLESTDVGGQTPLLAAAGLTLPSMVQLLVESGAAVNVKSPISVMGTPLVITAGNPNPTNKKNNIAILNYLLSRKADVNFPSGDGTTALMAASRQSDKSLGYERAALLIGKGANLDATNDKGETALMLASGAGNDKLTRLLMDKGANAKLKNGAGETAMSYAKRAGGRNGAGLIESAGVSQEEPTFTKSVIVGALVGTWSGPPDGLPMAMMTLMLNKSGAYSFTSKLTAQALKQYPAGSVKPVIAAHQGKYSINGDTLILKPTGAPPTSMRWKLEKGVLIIDSKSRLKKIG